MSLWVLRNQYYTETTNDLRKICPDPGLSFDLNLSDQVARVNYTPSRSSVGCDLVEKLVTASAGIGIVGANSSFPIPETSTPNQVLSDRAGYTLYDRYPTTSTVDIAYDCENAAGCSGRGYWVEDAAAAHIDYPTDVSLFHEMTHAKHLVLMGFTSGISSAETDAIKEENLYRAQRSPVLPARSGYNGGCNAPPPVSPTPGGGSGKSRPSSRPGGGCFIATAALDSQRDETLDFLRAFRDDVICATSRGADWFDALYAYYYQASPQVVREMEKDDRLRELILVAFVLPLINYLKLAVRLPDQPPSESLPEPWQRFFSEMIDDLEMWSSRAFPPRTEFPNTYTADDIADEIDFVMRYILRSPESRSAFERAVTERSTAFPPPGDRRDGGDKWA
jgi:hypothetical protein